MLKYCGCVLYRFDSHIGNVVHHASTMPRSCADGQRMKLVCIVHVGCTWVSEGQGARDVFVSCMIREGQRK